MADYEDGIFSNLPQRRRRLADDDNTRSFFRESLGMYVPEGPLPPRPHASGKGGPSLGVSNAPPTGSASPVVTGTAAVGQTLTCSQGTWFNSPTSYTYQWLRDGANIAGATVSTYGVVAGDLGHAISCTVTATNSFGSTPATSNAVLIVAIPVNTVAPAITGTATVGSTLSCSTGTWTNSPTSYTYQWLQNGVNISGATASTYVVLTGDAGTSIRCTVTAINATASGSATSNALAIAALPSAPANTVAPVVSGTATVGSTLSCSQGTWTNSPTGYAYQWQRNGVDTSGATGSTYLTVTADGGTSVSCRVAATNAGGTTSIASNTLAIAAGATGSVWSASDASANSMTLSNGGLTVTPSGAGSWQSVRGSISKSSGMVYVEFANSVTAASTLPGAGTANAGFTPTTYLGGAASSFGGYCNGTEYGTNFTAIHPLAASVTPQAGDVAGMAIDFGAGNVWLAYNNVWVASGNPATGANPSATFTPATVGALFPAMVFNGPGNGVWTLQSQPAQQKYLPPVGFQAWDGGPVTPSASVWSASDAAAGSMTLTNGGLTVTPGAAGDWQAVRSTTSKTSGKVYVEFSNSVAASTWLFSVGLASAGITLGGASFALGGSNYSVGIITLTNVNVSAGFTKNYTPNGPDWQPAAGTVFALAIDFAAGSIWFADNNVWTNSSNPATGSLPAVSFVPATVGALFAAMDFGATGVGVWTLQATAASQKYAPPSGFTPWG